MLVLIAFAIWVLVGEKIRDRMYRSKKWNRYSGVFFSSGSGLTLSGNELRKMKVLAHRLFQQTLYAPEVVSTWFGKSGISEDGDSNDY